MNPYPKLTWVYSRWGSKKAPVLEVSSSRPCSLEGCRGTQIHVRWSRNCAVWLCAKGLTFLSSSTARIGSKEEWDKHDRKVANIKAGKARAAAARAAAAVEASIP